MRSLAVFHLFLLGCASASYLYAKSDHFDGSRFFFPGKDITKGFGDLLKWQLGGTQKEWPKWRENPKSNDFQVMPAPGQFQFHYINHATIYVRSAQQAFITDPVWSERTSPFQWVGPKRVRAPGAALEDLPRLDFVIISHNHYDHLDTHTLVRLKEKFDPMFLVPLGDGALLKSVGVTRVTEMDWHDKLTIGDSEITFLPSQHWSARGLFDRNKCLWGSFMVKSQGKKIYFAGDTGYGDFFQKIVERYGSMDFAMLPIGAYEPRWFMRDAHMNPEDAVKAHMDLGAKASLGIHFGTWQLTDEGIDEPLDALAAAMANYPQIAPFHTLTNGETLTWE